PRPGRRPGQPRRRRQSPRSAPHASDEAPEGAADHVKGVRPEQRAVLFAFRPSPFALPRHLPVAFLLHRVAGRLLPSRLKLLLFRRSWEIARYIGAPADGVLLPSLV